MLYANNKKSEVGENLLITSKHLPKKFVSFGSQEMLLTRGISDEVIETVKSFLIGSYLTR